MRRIKKEEFNNEDYKRMIESITTLIDKFIKGDEEVRKRIDIYYDKGEYEEHIVINNKDRSSFSLKINYSEAYYEFDEKYRRYQIVYNNGVIIYNIYLKSEYEKNFIEKIKELESFLNRDILFDILGNIGE